MGNREAVIFKLTMSVFAKTIEAKDDLRAFVWDFGQEHNQVSINVIHFRLVSYLNLILADVNRQSHWKTLKSTC